MQKAQTTVVAVIGAPAQALARAEDAVNVGLARLDRKKPALERAVEAWSLAARSSAPYFLHDADPLEWVQGAWTRRFEGGGLPGELEVAVTETVGSWRAQSLELPDYYLLVDPQDWAAPRRHWYLGVLLGAAPTRVVTVTPAELLSSLPHLPPGPWWPDLDQLLCGIEHLIPEHAGHSSQNSAGDRLVSPHVHPKPATGRAPTKLGATGRGEAVLGADHES